MIKCPKCNTEEVYAEMLVIGYARVNVNTFEVDEAPDCVEAYDNELDDVEKLYCFACDYEWYMYSKYKMRIE